MIADQVVPVVVEDDASKATGDVIGVDHGQTTGFIGKRYEAFLRQEQLAQHAPGSPVLQLRVVRSRLNVNQGAQLVQSTRIDCINVDIRTLCCGDGAAGVCDKSRSISIEGFVDVVVEPLAEEDKSLASSLDVRKPARHVLDGLEHTSSVECTLGFIGVSHIPSGLTIDLHDGTAWIGIVPFHMSGVTLRGVPALPWVSAFPELNVRTYVTAGGKPFPLRTPDDIVVATLRHVEQVVVPESEVVFVGYGIEAPEYNWDDWKDVDVRGKTEPARVVPLPFYKRPKT